jgi:hypothetical protein
MIEQLGPEARALLDAAREGLSPDPAAVRRVRARIASGGAAAGTAIGVKLGVVAVIAAVAVGIAVYAARDVTAVAPGGEPARPQELPVRSAAAQAAPAASFDEDLITIEPAEASAPGASGARGELRAHSPAPRAEAAPSSAAPARGAPARTAGIPAAPAGSRAAPRAIDLAREVELVDLAMAALRRGDAGEALAAVRRHAAETGGRGQLAEDAAAIEIEALCRRHDPTTAARLAAFDARFPRSAQRSRLTSRCP